MKNQARRAKHSQSGSIFTMILIFIALFAALSYVIGQGSRTGGATIKKEQASLAASEMIAYGQQIQSAVKMLFINGCTDSTISFESPETVGATAWGGAPLYLNASSPTNKSCHVYYPNGGGMNFAPISAEARVAGYTPAAGLYRDSYRYYFGATVNFVAATAGGTSPEITMWATHITTELCDAINQKLGITGSNVSVPTVPINGALPYKGIASYANSLQVGTGTSSDLFNKRMGCLKATNPQDDQGVSGGNSFFTVLYFRQ